MGRMATLYRITQIDCASSTSSLAYTIAQKKGSRCLCCAPFIAILLLLLPAPALPSSSPSSSAAASYYLHSRLAPAPLRKSIPFNYHQHEKPQTLQVLEPPSRCGLALYSNCISDPIRSSSTGATFGEIPTLPVRFVWRSKSNCSASSCTERARRSVRSSARLLARASIA